MAKNFFKKLILRRKNLKITSGAPFIITRNSAIRTGGDGAERNCCGCCESGGEPENDCAESDDDEESVSPGVSKIFWTPPPSSDWVGVTVNERCNSSFSAVVEAVFKVTVGETERAGASFCFSVRISLAEIFPWLAETDFVPGVASDRGWFVCPLPVAVVKQRATTSCHL